jgi:signal transduction histidine kinase/CheY-like chemotaxis protein
MDSGHILVALARVLHAGVFVVDSSARISFTNDVNELERIGLPRAAAMGQEPLSSLASGAAQFLRETLRDCLATNAAVTREMVAREPSGERVFLISLAPLRSETGQGLGVVGLSVDVTSQRRQEDVSRQAQKFESLGRLAAGVAHDFNNLLVGIMGHASLAMQNLSPVSRSRLNLEQLLKASERAAEFTQQLMAYGGKGSVASTPVDLNILIKGNALMLEAGMPGDIALRQNLSRSLPPTLADASQLQQAITALLNNAVEAIGGARGVVTVSTGTETIGADFNRQNYVGEALTPGEYLWVEVADTGAGLPPGIAFHMFDPFFTTKASHRGLGLSSVLLTVRRHRGGIAYASEPGRGTAFRIYIPIVVPRAAPAPAANAFANFRGTGVALVVDDEESVRTVAQQILQRMGFTVYAAEDGKQGVELAVKHITELQVVLLDMTMPVMSGEEAFRSLRLIKPDLNIILSSGYTEAETMRHFTSKGLAGFLQKPYTVQALTQKIADVCSRPGTEEA